MVIEARDRLGGRCAIDERLGFPVDLGAAWLHSADRNPLTALARDAGLTVVADDGDSVVRGAEAAAVERAAAKIEAALERAGEAGRDVALGSLVRVQSAAERIAAADAGPLEYGVELGELSTLDAWRQIGTGDERLVREGLGRLPPWLGSGLEVRFGVSATRIDWSGPGVSVATTSGALRARVVVVTVSTGVLRTGSIGFRPALPTGTAAALDDLPMGLLDKAFIRFAPGALPVPPDTNLSIARPDGTTGDAVLRPFGLPLAVVFTGGERAQTLARAGEAAALAAGIDILADAFGASLRSEVVAGFVTSWGADPFARGSYSAARPGGADARAQLARPVGDRILFAGEATDPLWATQTAGAWRSGLRAGAEAARLAARG